MTDDCETAVPDDDSPVRCRHCGRPFADETYRTLHEGIAHYEGLDSDRRAAFADAYETEQAAIRRFRLKALAVLVALYFCFLWAYVILA